jgi:hypothetical protein
VALTGGCIPAAEATESTITLDALRNVSTAHGTNLSDDRLRLLKPALERRLPQLRALRDFEIDDAVAPVQGILDE